MSEFARGIDAVIDGFKRSPSKVVVIDEATLLAAAREESGRVVTLGELRLSISETLNGAPLSYELQEALDGASYACEVVANNCFREVPFDDDDGDFEYRIEWVTHNDGSIEAQVSL
jgi:hypothetical protein